MPKETFWFSHDYHARTDKELLRLRMKYGLEGIGIFWCIVEMLYEEKGYLMLSECERIAFELQTNIELVNEIIIRFELFKNDGQKFWSDSILYRLGIRKDKSESASKAALKRWDNQTFHADALPTHSGSNAIKNNIVKNNKEKYIVEDIADKHKKVKFEIVGLGEIGIEFYTNCERWEIKELFHFLVNSQKEFEVVAMTKNFMNNGSNFQFGLQEFVKGLQEKGDYKQKHELNKHFVNWLNTQNGSLEKLKTTKTSKTKIILK